MNQRTELDCRALFRPCGYDVGLTPDVYIENPQLGVYLVVPAHRVCDRVAKACHNDRLIA